MCEKCDHALMAAATSADLLSQAAERLHNINMQSEAVILAKAAAELFTEVKHEGETGAVKPEQQDTAELPRDFHIDEKTGIVYIHGVAVGQAVIIKRPTKH